MYCRVLGAKNVNVEGVVSWFQTRLCAARLRRGGRDLSGLRTDLPLRDVVEWHG
jgi:hypothetical protein